MKNVTELLPTSGQLTTRTRVGSQVPTDRATAELVNEIFKKLRVMCTAWKQAVEGDINGFVSEYKRTLLEALVRERVSDWSKIERGLASTDSPFLPNPNDFAKTCSGAGEITGSWGTGAHKPFDRSVALEDLTGKDHRREFGRQKIKELQEMLA